MKRLSWFNSESNFQSVVENRMAPTCRKFSHPVGKIFRITERDDNCCQ